MLALVLATWFLTPPELNDRPMIVVVIGAEGEPKYGEQFAKWADRWAAAAKQASAHIEQVGRDTSADSTTDRDRLHKLLNHQLADNKEPLWLVLIGHGTFDGREAKFNLRGPDISAGELADWLKPAKRPLVLINTTSASGPFVNRLAAAGRIVITATRSGHEHNFARFGDHLSAAIVDPEADLDKDGQTSLLEAYLAASHRTAEFYKQEARLATEHALLDDNGDGLGTPADWFEGVRATKRAKDGAALDGLRAHQLHLVQTPQEQAIPAELRARRDELEVAIESLRDKKALLAEDDYYRQLERLLVELAKIYEQTEAAAATSTAAP